MAQGTEGPMVWKSGESGGSVGQGSEGGGLGLVIQKAQEVQEFEGIEAGGLWDMGMDWETRGLQSYVMMYPDNMKEKCPDYERHRTTLPWYGALSAYPDSMLSQIPCNAAID